MIVFKDGTRVENTGNVIGKKRILRGVERESIEIHIPNTSYATVARLFTDGAQFSISTMKHVSDTELEEVIFNKFEYDVAGDIIDKRDGTFIVYMGVKTSEEKLSEEFAAFVLETVGG